jgi:hypothetical protein
MMEAARTSETLVQLYQTTRCYNPEDSHLPTILLFETLFCMWECFNMGTDLPTEVMYGQMLVLMQMTFLNNVRKVDRLVLSRTSCSFL